MRQNWHEKSFFGMHYDLHPGRKDTSLGLLATEEHIRRELEKVGPDFVQYDCKGHPGYAGYPTKVGMSSPGIRKDALKVWSRVAKKMGIPISIHYSGIWDDVCGEKHPDWTIRDAKGKSVKGRMCPNSPYAEKLVIPQIIEVIDKYGIDGVWVDGDIWAFQVCYCNRCRKLFRQETGKNPPKNIKDKSWRTWLEFQKMSYEQYVIKYVKALQNHKEGFLVCTNWCHTLRQPEEIMIPVDYLSGDFTPSFSLDSAGLEARFMDSRGMTWDLMAWTFLRTGESTWVTKSAEHLMQESAVVIANGGSLFLYEQPQRNGHLIEWHHDIFAKVAKFVRARQRVCQNAKSVPQVAILHSQNNFYSFTTDKAIYASRVGEALKPLEGAFVSLRENHYHVDVLNEDALLKRIKEYNMVVIAEQNKLPDGLVKAVIEYARNGGRVLISGEQVVKTFSSVIKAKKIGIEEGTFYVSGNNVVVPVNGLWVKMKLTGAKKIAPLFNGQEPKLDDSGMPSASINKVGKGMIAVIYGPVFSSYAKTRYPGLREFIGQIAGQIAGRQIVEVSAPTCVEMTLRKKDNLLVVNLINHNVTHPLRPDNPYVEGVTTIDTVRLKIKLPKKPKRVYLVPKDRTELKWEWRKGKVVAEISNLHIHTAIVVENRY